MLVTVLASAPFTVNADDSDPEFVFERSYNSYDGSQLIKLVQYNGSSENVDIPDKVPDDYPDANLCGRDFSIIRESTFYGNTNIKSVTIHDNINHIAGYAFCGCSNLEEVTIGTSLDYLGDSCFANCPNLSKVTIYSQPSNFSFGRSVFDNSPNVTVYGYHSSQIESVMTSAHIPFKGIDHSYGAPVWNWEEDYSAATASFSCFFGDDTQTIEATITSEIIENATVDEGGKIKYTASVPFGDQTYTDERWDTTQKLEHVEKVFPTAVSNGHIEYWYNGRYYSDANGEHEITEAETVIPYFTFGNDGGYIKLISYNGNDENVTVPAKIPDNYPDASLRGQTVTVIYDEAFKDNTTIKSVTIPDTIVDVDYKSFDGCTNLETVSIGTGLNYLAEFCFANCPKLEKVTIYSEKNTFNMKYDAFLSSSNVTVYGYCGTTVYKKMKSLNIPFESLSHAYGEPVWDWSEDKSSVTATFTCEKCQEAQTVTATIKIERTEPTGSKDGEIKYTATAKINGQTYTDVKTEVIPKLHDLRHIEKVFPTQEQNGNIEYWFCPDCGKYFRDADGKREITQAETILPYFTFECTAVSKYIKLVSYNGKDENVAIPTVIPDNYPDESLCGKTVTIIREDAFKDNTTVKNVTIPDSIDYVAADSFRGCTQLTEVTIGEGLSFLALRCFANCPELEKVTIYSKKSDFRMHTEAFDKNTDVTVYGYHDTKVEEKVTANNIPFVGLEHIYGEPEWTWNGYSSATAAFTCTHNDDTQTVEAQITSKVTKRATCLEEGEITYTATVTFEGKTYTDVKTDTLPKKHALERVDKAYPTVEKHGNIEYWRCPDCGKLFADENGEHEITEADTVLPLFTFGEDDGYIKLISYNGNDESVLVPDKVPDNYPDESLRGQNFTIIKEAAFRGNSAIRNVIMQNNIAHIGDSAFEDCENLTEIIVGTNLDYIGINCFKDSPELKKITIYSKDSQFGLNVYAFDFAGDDITVYGYRNTKVESAMINAGIPFIPLDPEEIEIVDVTYSVDKTWDIDFADKDKPGSIQVVLQRKTGVFSWETLQLVTLDETNNHWRTDFAPVPSAHYDEENEAYEEYEYRIRELGPKKAEDAELDPNAEDFQDKVKERLIYDKWDYDRPVIKQLIASVTNPEVMWQFEPNIEWVKGLAKTTVVSPSFVMFDIDGYNDGVKDIPKHTTKYMVTYEDDENEANKTNITNLAVVDTTVYKRWLNFEESEKPESVYLMLESKAQTEYAAANGLTQTNFYTPSFDAVVGSLNLTDIPISGETIRGKVNEGISKNLGGPLSTLVTTGTDALFTKYFSTGLTVGKATPDSQNPLTRWRVKFTVKKYGTALKLPMDYAGAELVTGMMEMIIDALIHEAGLDISVPVMYEPFGQYWSIKGYALSLIHDYERTCNVINIKFHSGDGDPDDPDKRSQVIGGTKYWNDDDASNRPSNVNLRVYYKDDDSAEKEVHGLPVTVTSGDTNGVNGWTWMLKIPAESPDRDKNYYIREEVPEGYAATYHGLDVINSKSQEEPSTESSTEPSTEVTEPTEEPTTVVTEPTEEPTTVVIEPTEEPTTVVTEPTEEPTTVVTEPPEEPSTQKTEPKTDPDDDDDDDDDDDPGDPIIVIPVPVIDPPVIPPSPDTPDPPDTPTQSTEATEATEETDPTEPDETVVVTKIWIGDTEDDRPSYLKIHIYNAGVEISGSPVKLSKSSFGGASTWISKPITLSQGVNKNTLTYAEEYPSNYQNRDNYASVVFGSTIFNTWLQTNITGTKTWIDGSNILNKRPDEITVNLMADGKKVDSVKTNAAKGWKYSFVNKPIIKTENDIPVKINYTVEEESVKDYITTYDGYDIINTLSNTVTAKGSYKFKYTDRYGDERIKTVEVDLNTQEILGYSGNDNQPCVPTYIWTAEAQKLFDKNPLVTAALAVTGNKDDDQKDVSVYKNDIEWDLIKFTADDATNMTPDSDGKSLTVLAQTKPYTFTFNYYFVKNGNVEYRGTRSDIAYGRPVTFSPEFTDPVKYEYISDEIPKENFCYWSADEAGLIPITTNRTFGMLMRGKWDEESGDDRVVNVYAQYNNNLTDDWMPLIEEAVFTHMIEDDNDWIYLDYMTNYLSKDGTVIQDLVAEGDENIRYGLIAVKHPHDSSEITRDEMISLTQTMIANDSTAIYTDETHQSVAYRFEYGKPDDTVKPITNFNRVLYTLRSDTDKAENKQFSVIAYITVDGSHYFYSKVNSDINVHELLSE